MFFEDSWPKYLIVLLVALIVIGPKELPAMLRTFGRLIGKLRRHADEFRRQFDESMREAGGDELKRELDQLRQHNPITQLKNTIEEAAREVTHPPLTFEPPPAPTATGTEPASPPVAAPGATATTAAQDASPTSAVAAPSASPATGTASTAQPHVNGADRQLP